MGDAELHLKPIPESDTRLGDAELHLKPTLSTIYGMGDTELHLKLCPYLTLHSIGNCAGCVCDNYSRFG